MWCSEPVLTPEQMEAAFIEPMYRDYCAHHLLEFYRCRREHFPWIIACKPQKHVWDQCQIDEYETSPLYSIYFLYYYVFITPECRDRMQT